MDTKVTEVAADVFRISTFNPDYGIQFNQFLVRDDEPFIMHTASLEPQTLALMHGTSFRGEGRAAILDLATVIKETLGKPAETVC